MIFDLVRWVRRQFRRPEGRNARRATRGPRLESLEDRTAPATLTWTGAGANANWSTRANWDLRAPRQGDSLVFPDGPAQVVANNNLPGMVLRSITFSGDGYSLAGRPVALTQGLQQTSAVTGDANVVGLSTIVLPRTMAFTINGTADVKVTGNILGAMKLIKTGTGTISLEGGKAVLFAGIDVRAGELRVAPLTSPGMGQSSIIVRNGAKLTGTGMAWTVVVQGGGTVSPADAEVGALRTRSVTFAPNSTFRVDLDEATSPNLDQLSVRGRAVISGSTLAATGVYGSGIASSYTILDNDGRDRVVGRFAGLAQGATLRVPGPDGLNPLFSINYSGGDGNDIVLTHINSAPEGDALSITTVEGMPRGGAVAGTDGDGDALTYNKVTDPEHGSVVMNVNGIFTYTPDDGYIGPDSFTFKANDGTADSEPETVSITVKPINEAPSFTEGTDQTALEDSGLHTVEDWATAISPGPAPDADQELTFTVSNNNHALFSVQPAISPDGTLTYTLAPNANGMANVTVTLSDDGGTDNGGDDTSATQSFTITATPVNDAPSFARGPDQTVAEDSGSHIEMGWATGISAGPADEAGQTLTFSVSSNNNALFTANGRPAISPDGTLTYTLAPNANGTANVTVTLSDNGGTADGGDDTSDPQSFVITVTAVGDGPVNSAPSSVTAQEDVTFPFSGANAVTVADADGNLASVRLTLLHGTLHVSTAGGATAAGNDTATLTVSGTQAAINATLATLTYKGGLNSNGPDALSILSTDSTSLTDSDSVALTVTAVNDAPSFAAGPDETVNEDSGAHTFPGWATAISAGPADEAGQTLTFSVSSNNNALFTANGRPAINPVTGELTYTLAPNANGTANVTVTLSDNGGTADGGVNTSASRSFNITVLSVNDAPQGADNAVASSKDMAHPFSADDFGFSDPNDSPADNFVAVVITTLPTNGTLKLNGDAVTQGQSVAKDDIDAGLLQFSPAAGTTGTPYASFTFQVADGGGQANGGQDIDPSPKTMTINVTAVNDAPTVSVPSTQTATANQNRTFSTGSENAITVADVESDTLVDGGTLTVTIAATGQQGSVALTLFQTTGLTGVTGNGTASVSFTGSVANINAALNGLTFNDDTAETGLTFTITVKDGIAPVVSDSFTINVTA